MTTTQEPGVKSRRCSAFSSEQLEDPGGSATWWRRCLIVEVKEPWAADVAQSRHFPQEVSVELDRAAAQGLETKLQSVTPDSEYSTEGQSTVIFFSRQDGPFSAYDKDEYQVPYDELGPLTEALLTRRDRLQRFGPFRQDTAHLRDILVCTHGAQDTCCGTIGYPIYDVLRDRYAREPGANLRVWRVSHLGGHRFAPNVLDLPEGRNWVRIGAEQLDALVHRTGPASALRGQYRGWVGMESPFEQLAEREAFMREGWSWSERLISSRLLDMDNDQERAEVRLEFSSGSGRDSGAYVAKIERTGSAPRVDCLTGERSGEVAQYTVTDLSQVG